MVLFLFLIPPIISYITFPLKKENITSSTYYQNIQRKVFSQMLESGLYIILNIGSQKVDIKAFLVLARTQLVVAGKNIKYHKYDETESFTYNMTSNKTVGFQYCVYTEGLLSTEKMTILNNNKESNFVDINFIVATKSSPVFKREKEGEVGFHLPTTTADNDYNLILNFKKNNITSSTYWYLNFDNFEKGEGQMIIDAFPHSLDSQKYKEENFVKTNVINRYAFIWGFKFSSINIGNQKLDLGEDLRAHIELEYGIISAPKKVGEALKSLFFESYMNQSICFQESIGRDGNYFFYCNKSDKLDIKKFESIFFNCPDLNIVFELNYQDLFYTEGDYVYFKIEFNYYIYWTFGEAFLKKYYIVFDQQDKTVGYYYTPMEEEEKEKEQNSTTSTTTNNPTNFNIIMLIIIIFLVIFCAIFVGLFIYNKKKERKKKANELDDDFNYEPKSDFDKDKNKILDDNNIESINTM